MSDPLPMSELLQQAADEIINRATADRCEVVRTSETEERAPIDPAIRKAVYARDRYRCQWCGADYGLQLDHIIPWSAGGADDFSNLRTLCSGCNTKRSNYAIETDYKPPRTSDGCLSCMPDRLWEDVMTTGRVWCIHCDHLGLGPAAFHA